jgi:hypothetical protein
MILQSISHIQISVSLHHARNIKRNDITLLSIHTQIDCIRRQSVRFSRNLIISMRFRLHSIFVRFSRDRSYTYITQGFSDVYFSFFPYNDYLSYDISIVAPLLNIDPCFHMLYYKTEHAYIIRKDSFSKKFTKYVLYSRSTQTYEISSS